jgi:hypothetical protein
MMKQWFEKLLGPFRLFLDRRLRYRHTFVEDPPSELEEDVVYLVGETSPWSASMRCPCGCKETIALSLVKDDRPSWKASLSKEGRITLYPSVWRTKGCKSHFILRDGRILWAKAAR